MLPGYVFLIQAPIPAGTAAFSVPLSPVICWLVYALVLSAVCGALWFVGRPGSRIRRTRYRRPLRSVPSRGLMASQQA